MDRILEISPEDLVARVRAGRRHRAASGGGREAGALLPAGPELARDVHARRQRRRERGRAARVQVRRHPRVRARPRGGAARPGRCSAPATGASRASPATTSPRSSSAARGRSGVVTEITLKLLPLPRQVGDRARRVPRRSTTPRAAVTRDPAGGVLPRCLELLDDVALAACATGAPYQFPAGRRRGAARRDGRQRRGGGVRARWPRRRARPGPRGAGTLVVAQNEAQRRDIWRDAALAVGEPARASTRSRSREDMAVPRSRDPRDDGAKRRRSAGEHGLRTSRPTATPGTATCT